MRSLTLEYFALARGFLAEGLYAEEFALFVEIDDGMTARYVKRRTKRAHPRPYLNTETDEYDEYDQEPEPLDAQRAGIARQWAKIDWHKWIDPSKANLVSIDAMLRQLYPADAVASWSTILNPQWFGLSRLTKDLP